MKQLKRGRREGRPQGAGRRVAGGPELAEYVNARHAGFRRAMKARSEAEAIFNEAIAASRLGKAMLAERQQLAEQLQKARQKLVEGKTTRLEIAAAYGRTLEKFERKYRPVAEDAWLKVADLAPSAYKVYRDLHDDEQPPTALNVQILYFFGLVFLYDPATTAPEDTGTVQQALDPPLDLSTSGFSLKIQQENYNAIAYTFSNANPGNGSMFAGLSAGAGALVPGVGGARALVGTEFSIPPGYTQFAASADFDWSYDLSTWVFLGGAGCGADLVIRIEPAGGASPVEKLVPLASVVAPAVWSAGARGSGSSSIALSVNLSGPSARSLKVFAGVSTHAEAEGVAGMSSVLASGTVKTMSLHAE